jgi:glutathione S-transferase
MKLYFAPRTRAIRPRWLLEELGVPYELVKLDLTRQENNTPEYLAVNPLGEVPALVDGEVTLLESLASCL